MINRNACKEAVASPERDAALSYVFGQYGADRHMPFAYEEMNQSVYPCECCCVVMGKTEGEVFSEHLRRHYRSSLVNEWSDRMSEAFERYYVRKYGSDIVRLDSEHNFQFGNLALTRIQTSLDREFMLVSPDPIMEMSLDSTLAMTESYMISHGACPDRASAYTARAFEAVASLAMGREGNGLSGIYAFDRIDMEEGNIFIGLSPAENGRVNCHFQRHLPDSRLENTTRSLHALSVKEMQRLLPSVMEFQRKFRPYLPSFEQKDMRMKRSSGHESRVKKGMKF
ncbi:MAG: hypothetical protein IJ504_01165 [Bacteroidales bacterium]|nr:hypothetical protein [Bacteroidales bacterium]